MDALAEQLKPLLAREYAACASANSLYDHEALDRIKHHYDARVGMRGSHFTRDAEARCRALFQPSADDGNIRLILAKSVTNSHGIGSGFFFSSRGRHTRWNCDWSSDVCSSDLACADLVRWAMRMSADRVIVGEV